ncbi:unnamed protein product [Peniophora sp. CBMAI 1063]|nr:unnamed protein product [Peniophora sp. CBMAI 1063]
MSDRRPLFFALPPELLIFIVDHIGPPDISCCDPGWLVVPAVCQTLGEITEFVIDSWRRRARASFAPHGIIYSWVPLLPDGPDQSIYSNNRRMHVTDRRLGVQWAFIPVYRTGNVEYRSPTLRVSPSRTNSRDSQGAVDDYLSAKSASHQPKRVNWNFSWLRSITLKGSSNYDKMIGDCLGFSFNEVPCLAVPALRELYLHDYIVDWRCAGLRVLKITMSTSEDGEPTTDYCFPPAVLFARMVDSRRTLQAVTLEGCFPEIPEEADTEEPDVLSIILFPRLCEFEMSKTMPHEAWRLCRRIQFPSGFPPVFESFGPGITFLRSLACEYSHSRSERHISSSGIDTLTIRADDEDCILTASRITSSHQDFREAV